MRVLCVRAAWAVVAAAAVGCSGGEKTATVTGKVTFEGEPVKEGRITFKVGPTGKGFSAEIKDGTYTAQVEPGDAVVEITASRPSGKFDTSNPGEKTPIGEMYIPGKYNTSSSLKETVKSGSNDISFALKK